jgi:uncharacterized cofD-like protein
VSDSPSRVRWIDRLRAPAVTRWLTIGLGVKRWLVLLLIGVTLLGLGLAYLLIDLYREQLLPGPLYVLTLQFLPRLLRALVFGGLGLGLVAAAVIRINQTLLAPFARAGNLPVAEAVYQYRQRERGPKIVAIGGGTGLSTLLRGLKAYTSNLTAIVTVADDGGSSGRLRRELGILPPGDFRQCIAALADDEALTTHLLQYRFGARSADGNGSGLNGHAFGNLLIAAMANITGSFEKGLSESSQVLAVRGRILPSTVTPLTLVADVQDDTTHKLTRVEGESLITHAGASITRIAIRPEDVRAYPDAIRAILDADAILLAPGSLYTSLLPNLLVPGVADAIRAARGECLYVCNVATQKGETSGYGVRDHVRAIEQHAGANLIDAVIANSEMNVNWIDTPPGVGEMIRLDSGGSPSPPVFGQDVIDRSAPWRHDSHKLALAVLQALSDLRPQEFRPRARRKP